MPTPPAKSRRLLVDGQETEIPVLADVGRAEFPGGPRAGLPPSLPSTEPSRRGRPRESSPTGDWVDSDYLARRVATIVGRHDERADDGAEILDALRRLVRRVLGRKLTRDEDDKLRTITLGTPEPPFVITRVLLEWRHGLSTRAVRRMQRSLNVPQADTGTPRRRVKLVHR